MPEQFPNLFSPIQVGSVTLRNRLMTASHSHDLWGYDPEGYHRWNLLGSRAMHYHAERAKGGFGLITTGQVMVHPSCGTNRPAGYLEEVVEAYRPIAEAIQGHGAKVFMQINHNGRGRISGTDDWDPVLTAKPDVSFYPGASGEFTKEIDVEEIADIVKGFGITARNMQRAGFDGVEIHAAHSYLLSEFLTPAYNARTDRYGGSLDNRMRFLEEVVDEVRRQVGGEFVVGVRLNTQWREFPGPFTVEDSIEVAKRLEASGKIDFINASAWSLELSLSGLGTPFGPVVPAASRVKAALSRTPLMVVGRIVDPVHAEQILAEGHADIVAMVRASIADPELPNKAKEGRLEDIYTCVGASQGCIGRHFQHFPITCTQNPAVGREAEWGLGTLQPAARKKRVLIAGGGPAGLEAAVIAARRGHEVVLCEQSEELGGQVKLILKAPRRGEFVSVISSRKTQIEKLGVEVRLATTVTPELVDEIAPDAVVVATGSAPKTPRSEDLLDYWSPSDYRGLGVPGAERPHVYTPWDVLNGAAGSPKHAVVLDGLGYYQSSDPLEYLADKGTKITALTTLGVFAVDMLYNDRPFFLQSLRGKDISFHQFTGIKEILETSVVAMDHQMGREFTIADVDAVVLSVGNVPRNALYYALKDRVSELYRVGDCVTPRKVEHAHFEGHKIAREI